MKIQATIVLSLALVLFYGLCYSIFSVLLDVILSPTNGFVRLRDLVEYFAYFILLYSLPALILAVIYKLALPPVHGKMPARIVAGIVAGLLLGLIIKKINVSIYIGEYRLFKSMTLFACCNVAVILLDYFVLKSRSGKK